MARIGNPLHLVWLIEALKLRPTLLEVGFSIGYSALAPYIDSKAVRVTEELAFSLLGVGKDGFDLVMQTEAVSLCRR